MNNGIFESVHFLNEFDFGSLFKKKEKKKKEDFTLDDETKQEYIEKIKKLISKHNSGLKKAFNSVVNDSKWPKDIKKFEYIFNPSEIEYDNSDGHFYIFIARLDLWEVRSNLRQAMQEGDPVVTDTLADIDHELIESLSNYCKDNNIKGTVENGGDWDDFIYELTIPLSFVKTLEI